MDFWGTFWRSFWSPLAYKEALTWRWKIVFYFLILCLYIGVFGAIAARPHIIDFFDTKVKYALRDMDSFEIVDGKIKTPEDKIYTYDFDNDIGFLSISQGLNTDAKDYLISIEGSNVFFQKKHIATLEQITSQFPDQNIVLDKEFASNQIDAYLNSYYLYTIPFLFLSAIASNMFFVLVLSLAAFTMTMTSPLKLGYFAGLKISVLAITPMVFFQSIGSFFVAQDSAGFLYGLISIVLVWYVIKKLPSYW